MTAFGLIALLVAALVATWAAAMSHQDDDDE